jgi:hypothetical protein
MRDLVPAQVPLVLDHFAALLAAHLAAGAVHVQNVLQSKQKAEIRGFLRLAQSNRFFTYNLGTDVMI